MHLPRYIRKWFYSSYSWAEHFLFPNNVVTCKDLPKSWCDRDDLMFHAMFQILVDFVELEQPFVDWGNKKRGRYKNSAAMREWIEKHFNTPEGIDSTYGPSFDDETKVQFAEQSKRAYASYMEILYLYEWYKAKKYNIDSLALYKKANEKIALRNGRLERDPRPEGVITLEEYHEIIEEHEVVCERMLQRILAIRKKLWT